MQLFWYKIQHIFVTAIISIIHIVHISLDTMFFLLNSTTTEEPPHILSPNSKS